MPTEPVRIDMKTIALCVSLVLNLLGGSGLVPPVTGPDCPPPAAAPPPAAE